MARFLPSIAAILLLTGLGSHLSCNRAGQQDDKKTPAGEPKLRVVATTTMITDLLKALGGDHVQVTGLMGPGVDPHLYKARAGDVGRMGRADVIFYNGLHLEGKMAEIFEQMRRRGAKTLAVTDCIDRDRLLSPPEFKGAYDPHVWFDVTFWHKVAGHVADTLIDADTEHADDYRSSCQAYQKKLAALHEYVKSQAAKVPQDKRVLITAHDAFSYFGRAYGFEVRGLQGISTAAEAGAADVRKLAAFIATRRIPAVFVESSVPARNIEAVQAAVRAKGFAVRIGGELFSDALGSADTPEGTYLGMVRHNIDTIVRSLLAN